MQTDDTDSYAESDISVEYSCKYDKDDTRTGIGQAKWYRDPCYQIYRGRFLRDCLHGRGIYTWTERGSSISYHGFLYANYLEGYGKFYYHNNCVLFEGLFKSNERFGPGVLTHTDGSQDVGMWYGRDLLRLCVPIRTDAVPRLARTPTGKVKLVRHKKLVRVCDDGTDPAQEILRELNSNDDVLCQYRKLYNVQVRNPDSNFFDRHHYDRAYFCRKNCYIKVVVSPGEENAKDNIKCPSMNSLRSNNKRCYEEHSEENCFVEQHSVSCVCEQSKLIRIEGLNNDLKCADAVLTKILKECAILKRRIRVAEIWETIPKKEDVSEVETVVSEPKVLRKRKVTTEESKRQSANFVKYRDPRKINEYALEEEGDLNLDEESIDDLNEQEEEGIVKNVIVSEETPVTEEETLEFEELDSDTLRRLLSAAQNAKEVIWNRVKDLHERIALENCQGSERKDDESMYTKKVLITDILAWNNEKISVEMMKQAFLYRDFEKILPFQVADILIGNRTNFKNASRYEEDCVVFLVECSSGNYNKASDLFYKNNLNPDICDSKGNTGLIFAAAQDKVKMIRFLINVGANVDSLNDECFTPLGLCVTRYFAVQNKVVDWEKAFLKPSETKSVEILGKPTEWRPHISTERLVDYYRPSSPPGFSKDNVLDLGNLHRPFRTSHQMKLDAISEIFGSNFDVIKDNSLLFESILKKCDSATKEELGTSAFYDFREPDEGVKQAYLFDTKCFNPNAKKKKKGGKSKGKGKGKRKKGSKSPDSKSSKSTKSTKSIKSSGKATKTKKSGKMSKTVVTNVETSPEDKIITKGLNVIFQTIEVLLELGADPNVCEIPIPSLIISVFAKKPNLTRVLLEYKANPNVTTMDDNLTALHVAAALDPCSELLEITNLLLKNYADSNIRAGLSHWPTEMEALVGNCKSIVSDVGKTVLHLLAMRYDFALDTEGWLVNMAVAMVKHGADTDALYLGHTPLTLAMMRGNFNLVEALLKTRKVNPDQELGESMGVPLTLFALKRFPASSLPPLEICCKIVDLLLEYGANPFNLISNVGNVIDFMEKEHAPPPSKKKDKKGKGKGKKGRGRSKSKSKSSTSSKSSKKSGKGKNKGTIQEKIKTYVCKRAVSVLKQHLKGWTVKYLYYFVAQENYYDKISENMVNLVPMDEVVGLVQMLIHQGSIEVDDHCRRAVYDLLEFITKVKEPQNSQKTARQLATEVRRLLSGIDFKKLKGASKYFQPETEKHEEKYNVCFNCLKKLQLGDGKLVICPGCMMVYFCSQPCNKASIKDTFHKCKLLFYNKQKDDPEEKLTREDHSVCVPLPTIVVRLQEDETWKRQTTDFGGITREIPADENRRLHLTREEKVSKVSVSKRSQGTISASRTGTKISIADKTVSSCKDALQLSSSKRSADKDKKIAPGSRNVRSKTSQESEQHFRKKIISRAPLLAKESAFNRCPDAFSSLDAIINFYKRLDLLKSMGHDQLSFSASDDLSEIGRRLPQQFQNILEKITQYWPDFDLSTLLLPYACFTDGQLYYRFQSNAPVFKQTYSHI